MAVQRLRPDDLAAVVALQAQAYHHIVLETEADFRRKLTFCADACFGFWQHDRLHGYVFSHPGCYLRPPKIGATELTVPQPNCWYLHDLVVDPSLRGQGVAQQLVRAVIAYAYPHFSRLCLISLAQASAFWLKQGFVVETADAVLQQKLKEYGEQACYMSKSLDRAMMIQDKQHNAQV